MTAKQKKLINFFIRDVSDRTSLSLNAESRFNDLAGMVYRCCDVATVAQDQENESLMKSVMEQTKKIMDLENDLKLQVLETQRRQNALMVSLPILHNILKHLSLNGGVEAAQRLIDLYIPSPKNDDDV